MSADSDFDLLRAWADGDDDAGATLFRQHFRTVFRFFSTKLSDDIAADLTQQTFLACTTKRDRIEPGSTFRAYLIGVARIELLRHFDEWRRRGSRLEPDTVALADCGTTPSGRVAEHEQQRLLLRALRRIPIDFQLTLELHYWEGMSTREIASALGIPAGTVKSRLSRARGQLKAVIASLDAATPLRASTIKHLDAWIHGLRGSPT